MEGIILYDSTFDPFLILIIVLVTDSEKLAVIVTFPELDIWVAPKVEVEVSKSVGLKRSVVMPNFSVILLVSEYELFERSVPETVAETESSVVLEIAPVYVQFSDPFEKGRKYVLKA